jgi:hypothetical protein
VRGGTRCRGSVRVTAVGEGVRVRVRCGGDGGGVVVRAVVGHQEKRERKRGEERTGDADATEQDIN